MLREMLEDLNEFVVLTDMIDEYEDEIPSDLQVSVDNFVKKVSDDADKFVKLLKKLQSFIAMDKEDIAALQHRIKSNEHYIKILRDTAFKLIDEGVPFIGKLHKVRINETERFDWDNANISAIPKEYYKIEEKIQRKKVTDDIKAGKLDADIVPKKTDKSLYIR
jgi:hypothetical protein